MNWESFSEVGCGWPTRDLVWILFPGLIGLALLQGIEVESPAYWALAILAVGVVDAGHVYTTAWRTVLYPKERDSRKLYGWAPVLGIAGTTLWLGFRLPYFWTFLAYLTLYHHIRQFYGVLRWYERLNGRMCRYSSRFLYALTLIPLVLCHFRHTEVRGIFTQEDFIPLQHWRGYETGLILYGAVVLAWIGYEIRLFQKGLREWSRLCAVLGPASVYGITLLGLSRQGEMVFPLLLAHGIPYFALMVVGLRRTQGDRFGTWGRAVAVVGVTAVVLGLGEGWVEDQWLTLSNEYLTAPPDFFMAFALGLFLTPLLCHYLFDAVIWKGNHPEARLLYGTSPANSRPSRRHAA